MTNSVTVNGNTYNDGNVAPNNMGSGGFRNYLFPMLADTVVQLGLSTTAAATSATSAATQASAAAASAAAAVSGPGTSATSASSQALALGTMSFTIQTAKNIVPGMYVVAAVTASPDVNSAHGQVVSYNSGTGALVITCDYFKGSGTFAAWTISLSAPTGLPNPSGQANKVLAVNAGATGYTTKTIPGLGGDITPVGSIVLTSDSDGVCVITPTSYGQYIQLPSATTCTEGTNNYLLDNQGDYPVEIRNDGGVIKGFINPHKAVTVGLADNSSTNGVWSLAGAALFGITAAFFNSVVHTIAVMKYVSLDADRCMLLFGDTILYGLIHNKTLNTWGVVTQIRSTGLNGQFVACLAATDKVLFVSCGSTTSGEVVVLSISALVITVNSAVTLTFSSNYSAFGDCFLMGTSVVFGYLLAAPTSAFRVVSISGTTPTIGAENANTGTTQGQLYATSSTILLCISASATLLYAKAWTIGGSTATAGTEVNTVSDSTTFLSRTFASAIRWAVFYTKSTGLLQGAVISLTGTVPAMSVVAMSAVTTMPSARYIDCGLQSTNKIVYCASNNSANAYFNTLTDNSGTAQAGTEITYAVSGNIATSIGYAGTNGNSVKFGTANSSGVQLWTVDASGTSPVLTNMEQIGSSATDAVQVFNIDNKGVLKANTFGPVTGYSTLGNLTTKGLTYGTQLAMTDNFANISFNSNCSTKGANAYESFFSGSLSPLTGIYKVEMAQ